jgi:prepilin-type processing-associated H-X9-DG protein
MNGLIGRDSEPSADRGWIRGADTLLSIGDPAKLVMLAETDWHENRQRYVSAPGPGPSHNFGTFHRGGFHASFFDGHVEKAKHGEFPIWTKPGYKWGDEDYKTYWIGLPQMRPKPE